MIRTAAKLTMYHGTCTGPEGQIIHSILKEGLKPDPKEKAYKSPYPDEDDVEEMYYDGIDFETETHMRLEESLSGAYLTNSIDEAKKYAKNACTEHGGQPVLVSAQIETRSPEVRIDEDFLINYVWEFVKEDFEPENDDRYYRELFDWLEGDVPDWERIAKGWIEKQFPHAKISDHRWKQILPYAAQMIEDIMIITFLKEYEQEAHNEVSEDDYWDVDAYDEVQRHMESYKESIEFVTDHLTEVTEPPSSGQHNIRILKNVGYRGANRITAVISWSTQGYYHSVKPGEYSQEGHVYYALSRQDAQNLLNASGMVAKYSKWTWRDEVLHDERAPLEQLRLPNVAHVIVAGRVYVAVDKKRLKQEYLLDQAQRDDSIPTLEEVIDYYRGDASTYEEEMSEEEFLAEVERLYNESVDRVRWELHGEDVYRGIKLPTGVDPHTHDGLGIFWSLSREGVANAVPEPPSVVYHARANEEYVNDGKTVWANSAPLQGPDEEEVQFYPHAPIFVYGFWWPNGDYVEIDDWRQV